MNELKTFDDESLGAKREIEVRLEAVLNFWLRIRPKN
jgi:hypothetical protein